MILEGEGEKIYRFRPYDRALSEISGNKKKELLCCSYCESEYDVHQNKPYLWFSDFEHLNDPNEGFREIFWEGDESDWQDLLLHYFFCLLDTLINEIVFKEKINDSSFLYEILHESLNDYKTEEYIEKFKLLKLKKSLLEDQKIIRIIKKFSIKKIHDFNLTSSLIHIEKFILKQLNVNKLKYRWFKYKIKCFRFKYKDYIIDILNKKFKILSFSKNTQDISTWAHYAQGYKGVCLIFDKQKLIYDLKEQNPTGEFYYKNVSYNYYFKKKNWFKMKNILNKSIDISNYGHLISQKLPDWANEEEIRIIAKNLRENKVENDYSALVGIIFGCSIKLENKISIVEQVKKMKNYSQVKFYHSMITKNIDTTKQYMHLIHIIDETDVLKNLVEKIKY